MTRVQDNGFVGQTVLVVDDERQIVQLVADLLTDEGYDVRCAYDGVMALEAVDRSPPDLVLTDVKMPRLDGVALARCLRERGCRVPVVLMSAVDADARLSGVPFVPKPFDLDHLVAVVGRALADAAA